MFMWAHRLSFGILTRWQGSRTTGRWGSSAARTPPEAALCGKPKQRQQQLASGFAAASSSEEYGNGELAPSRQVSIKQKGERNMPLQPAHQDPSTWASGMSCPRCAPKRARTQRCPVFFWAMRVTSIPHTNTSVKGICSWKHKPPTLSSSATVFLLREALIIRFYLLSTPHLYDKMLNSLKK